MFLMSKCLHSLYIHSPCLHVSFLHVSRTLQTENGSNRNQQLPFVYCKQEAETENFRLIAENGDGKWKFVFLSWQTINGNR
jgi:hypothetical protein